MNVPSHTTVSFERLDQICVRRYGNSGKDIVIYVLNQNPGLEKYGIVLPANIKIKLPELPETRVQTPVIKQIYLWS